MLMLSPACRSPPQNTTAVGLAASNPSRTVVSSSSEPAGFALALRRPLALVWVGWCPAPKVPFWVGYLPSTSSDFRNFRTHGPRMRIGNLSAPSGRFVARVSASVVTVDRRPGSRTFSPTANAAFRFNFCRTLRGRPGLCGSPRFSDDCRPARSSPDERFTGRIFRCDH